MKSKFKFFGTMVFGLMLIGMPPLYAQEVEPSPEEVAYQEAMQYRMAELEEIAANRDAVIDEIIGTWSVDANGWEEKFSINVGMADDSKLLAIRNAESFDEIITILDGDTLEHLGDSSADLVYTPVTPCRIVDTRKGGGGFISAGSTRHYNTYGNLVAQGGSNCVAPRGEPSAVHISMTAVNPDGKGNLKAHPFNTPPTAGLGINFGQIGTNLANAGTVKVTRFNDKDISISANYAGAHVTAQVLGYYYPVDEDDFKVQYVKRENNYLVAPNTSYSNAACACPTGYYVVGGGWWSRRNVSPHYQDRNVHAYTDRPNGTSGWIVSFRNDTGYYHWLTVYAICLKLN